jgi:ABC-type multidrug transport system permease subunit
VHFASGAVAPNISKEFGGTMSSSNPRKWLPIPEVTPVLAVVFLLVVILAEIAFIFGFVYQKMEEVFAGSSSWQLIFFVVVVVTMIATIAGICMATVEGFKRVKQRKETRGTHN